MNREKMIELWLKAIEQEHIEKDNYMKCSSMCDECAASPVCLQLSKPDKPDDDDERDYAAFVRNFKRDLLPYLPPILGGEVLVDQAMEDNTK